MGDVTAAGNNVEIRHTNIRKGTLVVNGNNFLAKDCRFMNGDVANHDSLRISEVDNVLFDHCDILWSKDDLTIHGTKVTFEYCVLGDGIGEASLGYLARNSANLITMYRCLYIHCNSRPVHQMGQFRWIECYFWNVADPQINSIQGNVTGTIKRCVKRNGVVGGGEGIVSVPSEQANTVQLYVEDCLTDRRTSNSMDQKLAVDGNVYQYLLDTEPSFDGKSYPDPVTGGWSVEDVKANVLSNVGARKRSEAVDLLVSHAQAEDNNTFVSDLLDRNYTGPDGWPDVGDL